MMSCGGGGGGGVEGGVRQKQLKHFRQTAVV